MKNREEAKLSMYSAVISFCYNHTDVIASIPALQAAFDSFKAIVIPMDAVSHNKENAIAGVTLNKQKLRENLAGLAGDLALKIFAYADATDNVELKARIKYTNTELLRFKDKELPGVCYTILQNVNENMAALAAYNVTAATVKEFTDAIQAYDGAVSGPRNAISSVSFNVSNFGSSFKQADSVLKNQVDKIVITLRKTNKQFYQTYFNNRAIVDPHTTPTQIKGKVTTKDNGEPLSGVTITISENGATTITNSDGRYFIKKLAPGPYTVEASRKGYTTVTVTNLDVKHGQITSLDITLVPVA